MSESSMGSKQVEQTVKDVLTRAKKVYDPLLARKTETDKIRQSLSVLSRFSFLFTLPSKIATNIRDGEYDKAVQHYKKAASIFQDQAAISHISVFLRVFSEVENIVASFRSTLYAALSDPSSSFEAQERVIRILVDLARPSDFRLSSEKDPRDDPGWYYLNMAASRMMARLSNTEAPPLPSSSSITLIVPDTPSLQLNGLAASQGNTQNNAIYKSVRSACGHVARHLPNLWKMGQYYLEGRFDPRNYGANDKEKEEMQAHPQREEKEKLDKEATARVFFSDETTSVRVDSRKPCSELVEFCLRRVEGNQSRRKKDGTKVIKITELAPSEKVNKLHKKWGDKSGLSHKFLFKRKDEEFPKQHDPRTVVETFSLERRTPDLSKKPSKQAETGKKNEADFQALISNVLSGFAERVEFLFFQEYAEDEFEADMATSSEGLTEEWAFGKMRAQVLDVVTTLNVLQRVGMSEKYLTAVTRLVLKLCGHYVSKVCGQWSGEVSLLYLSAVPRTQGVSLDSSVVNVPLSDGTDPAVHLPLVFAATTKFYLAQFKGIVSKGHPLMTQIQAAFGESLKCFADTLHHLAFNYADDEYEDEKATNKVHNKLRIVSYILETRNLVIGSLWSHFNELFKLSTTHQVEEEVLSSPLEVLHHLGSMTVARYLTGFTKILRYGILLAPAVEWATAPIPTAVSEYAMSVLLHFVYVSSELAILEPGSESYREHRHQFEKAEKEGLLEGTPTVVIGKLIGGMVWGMMEGFRRCLSQLDGGTVSVCGIYQLRLDFCFLEAILSRYSTEQTTGISQAIHAMLSQMEDDASQNGAGEDPIEVDIDAIVEDTSRRSVVLFGSLTGNAESPISPKIQFTAPKREPPKPKKPALSGDLTFGKDPKVVDMMRKVREQQEATRVARESSVISPKMETVRSAPKIETPPRSAPKLGSSREVEQEVARKSSTLSIPKGEDREKERPKENGTAKTGELSMMDKLREERKEKERERAQKRLQERGQKDKELKDKEQKDKDQKDREQQEKDKEARDQREKEQKEKEHKEKENAPVLESTASSGALSSREQARLKLRERELAKRK